MVDAALLGFVVGILAGIVAMCFDLFDLDWGWGETVVPLVLFPIFVSVVFALVYLAASTLLR